MNSGEPNPGKPKTGQQVERLWGMLLGVWALAVSVRCLYLWQIRGAVFFDLRFGDAESYHIWARRIADGDWLGHEVFYQAPLYPYFLALVYRVAGDGVPTVRIIQAVMGGGSCALLARAGSSLFGRRGAIAGVLLALYPPAIFLDCLADKSALVTLLVAALLALAMAAESDWRMWGAVGATLGLLALARENALVLTAPILAWLATGPTFDSRRGRWRSAAALAAGCALILLPVALRNRAAGGPLLTTAQFGPNFYIGNHEGADGTYRALVTGHGSAADEREDATRIAEQAAGRKLTAGEVSSYWTRRAVEYIRSQPLEWLTLTARKLALTFNAAEMADTESQQVYEERSWLLRQLGWFDFSVLLALAALGAALTRAKQRQLWLLYGLAGAYALSVSLFYVFARYRFPVAPVLMLVAAGGLLEFGGAWQWERRRVAVGAAAALAAWAFAHLPLDNPRAARATNYFDIASALVRGPARFGDAMEYYQRALDVDPRFPAAHFGLATLLTRLGRPVEAIPHYQEAASGWPDYAEAHYNFGLALAATGRPQEAAEELAQTLRLSPNDADAYAARGKALLALSRPAEAAEHFRRGLALRPGNAAALVGLGVALAESGRPGEAMEQYRLALAADPQNAAAHNSLGTTLASQGRIAEAMPHFERAVELNPSDENARRNLEAARKILGRP